jgi:hypothetical protein
MVATKLLALEQRTAYASSFVALGGMDAGRTGEESRILFRMIVWKARQREFRRNVNQYA